MYYRTRKDTWGFIISSVSIAERRNMKMKAGKISSIICIMIILFICIMNMHALGETAFTPKENIKIENSIINDQYNELNVYDVTYKDFQKVYTSAMFNSGEVVSTKSESADERAVKP